MDISFISVSKSVKTPALILRSFTLPLNLRDSQSVHLSGSGGISNLNGPRLVAVVIGRLTNFVAFDIFDRENLYGISSNHLGGIHNKPVKTVSKQKSFFISDNYVLFQ